MRGVVRIADAHHGDVDRAVHVCARITEQHVEQEDAVCHATVGHTAQFLIAGLVHQQQDVVAVAVGGSGEREEECRVIRHVGVWAQRRAHGEHMHAARGGGFGRVDHRAVPELERGGAHARLRFGANPAFAADHIGDGAYRNACARRHVFDTGHANPVRRWVRPSPHCAWRTRMQVNYARHISGFRRCVPLRGRRCRNTSKYAHGMRTYALRLWRFCCLASHRDTRNGVVRAVDLRLFADVSRLCQVAMRSTATSTGL